MCTSDVISARMCMSSVSNVIYPFSHFYTLNGKNVYVMFELVFSHLFMESLWL